MNLRLTVTLGRRGGIIIPTHGALGSGVAQTMRAEQTLGLTPAQGTSLGHTSGENHKKRLRCRSKCVRWGWGVVQERKQEEELVTVPVRTALHT